MDQPLYRQAETGNGGANRIHQKGHIVIDYREPQMPVVLMAADAFQRQACFVPLALVRASQGEPRRFFTSLFVKTDILARQGAFPKSGYQSLFQTAAIFALWRRFWFEFGCHSFPQVDHDGL